MGSDTIGTLRRWSMLGIGLFATLCANVFINGVAFLIPTLHTEFGLDLARAGLISAMPAFGMVLTLIAWGAVVDRVGERAVLSVGSGLTAAAALGAALAPSLVWVAAFLFLGGMAAASSNSASGRLVVGWFAAEQRGLAMGIRQTAQPLGVGLGALVIPRLAQSYGVGPALLFPAAMCALAAAVCAAAVVDPPRDSREQAPAADLANPYRGSRVLWRIQHLADAAQFDHFAVFHHQHLVRHGADHVHIVGDEHIAQTLAALQALQQRQHLLLDGDIERAGGLVQHQHVGLHHEGAGNRKALSLATRKLVRIALQQTRKLGFIHTHIGQGMDHARQALRARQIRLVNAQAFAHNFFHRHAW